MFWSHIDRPLSAAHARGSVDAVALFLFAVEQRDAFAVFTHPRQHIAIFSFGLVLLSDTAMNRRPMSTSGAGEAA